ncbi:flagellar brake protein [Zooshikella harenae]|uniref:Flagellar brake protein n=1 Tax=Zooshikella harenae TaxID=2827238 RepID=A0ABS5ZI73_9GAMM|nr:flagellar brake protein [Zooshikella harenae]MBU2712707.1 flagellar brake protein [Zooshikella harenae]
MISFSDWDSNEKYQTLQTPQEIYRQLLAIYESKKKVHLDFPAKNSSFSATISAINHEASHFTLSNITPAHGESLIKNNMTFNLKCTHHGIDIICPHLSTLSLMPDTTTASPQDFLIPFPDKIRYLQRRNAYRAVIPTHTFIRVTLITQEPETLLLSGQLLDLSITGCQLQLLPPPPDQPTLAVGDIFDHVQFITPTDHPIDCQGEIRQIHVTSQQYINIGIMFLQLSGINQRYLQLYVNQLQRIANRDDATYPDV